MVITLWHMAFIACVCSSGVGVL